MKNPCPLITLPLTGAADWQSVKQCFASFPDEQPGYVRLLVEVEDFLPPEANAEAAEIAMGKACRFCFIQTSRKAKSAQQAGERTFTTAEIQRLSPLDIARLYAEDKGLTFADDMASLLQEVLTQLRAEEREEPMSE